MGESYTGRTDQMLVFSIVVRNPLPDSFLALGRGRIKRQPRHCLLLASKCMQITSEEELLFFFLEVGQYSPTNLIGDKKREARSDIKEDSKVSPPL